MGRRVTFIVPGRPSAWKRTNVFAHPSTGKIVKVTDKAMRQEQAVIAQLARLHWKGEPSTKPILLRVLAIYAIPESWTKSLKAAAREARVWHVSDPDLDQIVKQVHDALQGIVYHDDNQVCGYPNSGKRYGSPERTEITIEELDQLEDAVTPGQRRLEAKPSTGAAKAKRVYRHGDQIPFNTIIRGPR